MGDENEKKANKTEWKNVIKLIKKLNEVPYGFYARECLFESIQKRVNSRKGWKVFVVTSQSLL
jgi:hypothetical protein